tara:strand:+ start:10184 stop:10357 length:174 start_codon:yes stop_codon:yes gene_type:complete
MALCERCKVKTNKTWSTKLEKRITSYTCPICKGVEYYEEICKDHLQKPQKTKEKEKK